MNKGHSRAAVVLAAGLTLANVSVAQEPGAPKDLNSCAAIETQPDRLACYDKLAGRKPAAPRTPAIAPTAPGGASRGGASSAAGASPNTPAPASGSKEAFGLYAAEHPTAPKASAINSITAKVVALNHDRYDKETISLEDGQVWQLAGSDALLASGDSVTIKRASFGSYVMTTPTGRLHRVRRLR